MPKINLIHYQIRCLYDVMDQNVSSTYIKFLQNQKLAIVFDLD